MDTSEIPFKTTVKIDKKGDYFCDFRMKGRLYVLSKMDCDKADSLLTRALERCFWRSGATPTWRSLHSQKFVWWV